jgi:hypothetical protein
MSFNIHKAGLIVGISVLVIGSLVQTFYGIAGPSPPQVWGLDDAYISYRYAQNLAQGNGLVFHRGERVEGYSNFLYVLMMTPAFFVKDGEGVYFFSVLLNLIFATGAFLLFRNCLQERLGEASATVGGLLFALCLPLWAAVTSGMETCLVLLLYLAIWVVVERLSASPNRGLSATLCGLMILSCLSRADGFLVPALAILFLVFNRRTRVAMSCAVPVTVGFGVYELWRFHYYGYFLPNSYYVKVAGPLSQRVRQGFFQLGGAALFVGLLPYLLILVLQLVDVVRSAASEPARAHHHVRFHLVLAAAWVAYWLYIGGDHLGDRFLLVLFPLGIFALLELLKESASRKMAAFVLLLVATLQLGPPLVADPRFRFASTRYDSWITLGKFVKEKYPGKSVATGAIGKIGFFSGSTIIDMLGVIDPVIAHGPVVTKDFQPAHLKYDPEYVLWRKPDLIADWINDVGDLKYGLTRSMYQGAGYRLAYLVTTSRAPRPANIVEVSGLPEETLSRLIGFGYDYALLVRR